MTVVAAAPSPTPTAPAIPVDVVNDRLDWVLAIGTVAAVVVAAVAAGSAVWLARRERGAADRRAIEDRDHARRDANARWQLDLLLRLAETFERWQLLRRVLEDEHEVQMVASEKPAVELSASLVQQEDEARSTLRALILAYPGTLPVLHAWVVEGRSGRELLAVGDPLPYGPVPGVHHLPDLGRFEIAHHLTEVGKGLEP
jgi:hypothetical protein